MRWLGGTTELPILTVPGPGRAAVVPGLQHCQGTRHACPLGQPVVESGSKARTDPGQGLARSLPMD